MIVIIVLNETVWFHYADMCQKEANGMANNVDPDLLHLRAVLSRGYKRIFMLNSAGHEYFPAHKC